MTNNLNCQLLLNQETIHTLQHTSSEGTVNPNIDMSKVKYRVTLGHFTGDIPVETIDVFMSIGGIRPVKNSDGSTTYYSKAVKSETEAKHLISDYAGYGIRDIEVVFEYNGKFYTQSEFLKLTE